MSHYDREQRVMDEVKDDLHLGSILKTVGWTLLLFNGIVVNWIWVGFRSGSYFWLYWTIIESSIGLVLVGAGNHIKARSGRRVPRLDTNADMNLNLDGTEREVA
jgi:hypothetical protein